MISEDLFWTGVRHVHSDTLSKFELVSIINSVFDLNLTINKISTPENCFRNLKTINNNLIKDSLYEQISDLRKFNIK